MRRKTKGAKWVERPAGNIGFEVTTEGIRTGTHSDSWRESTGLELYSATLLVYLSHSGHLSVSRVFLSLFYFNYKFKNIKQQ